MWFVYTRRAGLFISTGMVSLSIPRRVICLYPQGWSVYTCRSGLFNTLTVWSVYTGQSISSYTDQWWPICRGSWSILARIDLSILVRAGLEGSGMRLSSSDMVGLSTLVVSVSEPARLSLLGSCADGHNPMPPLPSEPASFSPSPLPQ